MRAPAFPFSAVVIIGPADRQFGIRIDGPQRAEIKLHPEFIRLSLQDYQGRHVDSTTRFRFDPCIPQSYGPPGVIPNYWIGFHFDSAHLSPGMYKILTSFDTGFATTSGGRPISLDPRYGYHQIALYVPPAPEHAPSLTAGQRFFALPAYTRDIPVPAFTGPSDEPIDQSTAIGRVITLERIGGARMQFHAEGVDGPLYLTRANDAQSIPGLYPLADDSSVRRLRGTYLNRKVWGYGGLYVLDTATGSDQTWEPLTVSGIYRARNYERTIGIGSPALWSVDLVSDFVALDPIVVTFKTPPSLMESPNSYNKPMDSNTALYFTVSDAWDFERLYSLVSIQRDHPEWPQSIIDDIQRGRVKNGMTKDMIAWMFGYPDSFGTKQQVRKLDTWDYDAPAPFAYTVHFRKGVVVKFDPPGNLP